MFELKSLNGNLLGMEGPIERENKLHPLKSLTVRRINVSWDFYTNYNEFNELTVNEYEIIGGITQITSGKVQFI